MGREVHYKDIKSKFLKIVIAVGAVPISMVTAAIAAIIIAVVVIALLIMMPIAFIVGRAKNKERK